MNADIRRSVTVVALALVGCALAAAYPARPPAALPEAAEDLLVGTVDGLVREATFVGSFVGGESLPFAMSLVGTADVWSGAAVPGDGATEVCEFEPPLFHLDPCWTVGRAAHLAWSRAAVVPPGGTFGPVSHDTERPAGRITYEEPPSRLWTLLPGDARALVRVRAGLATADGAWLDASHDGEVVARSGEGVEVRVAFPGLDPAGPVHVDLVVSDGGVASGVVRREGRVIGAFRGGEEGLRVEWSDERARGGLLAAAAP